MAVPALARGVGDGCRSAGGTLGPDERPSGPAPAGGGDRAAHSALASGGDRYFSSPWFHGRSGRAGDQLDGAARGGTSVGPDCVCRPDDSCRFESLASQEGLCPGRGRPERRGATGQRSAGSTPGTIAGRDRGRGTRAVGRAISSAGPHAGVRPARVSLARRQRAHGFFCGHYTGAGRRGTPRVVAAFGRKPRSATSHGPATAPQRGHPPATGATFKQQRGPAGADQRAERAARCAECLCRALPSGPEVLRAGTLAVGGRDVSAACPALSGPPAGAPGDGLAGALLRQHRGAVAPSGHPARGDCTYCGPVARQCRRRSRHCSTRGALAG